MITIIDYGAGNLASIQNMLKKIGVSSKTSSNPAEVGEATKIILPGVGHFDHGMRELRKRGLVEPLNERALSARVPVLGICLGAQMLGRGSEEGGQEPGLGWIAADVKRFDASRMDSRLKVPHMGWSDVEAVKPSGLFEGMHPEPRFYFVHAYHLVCDDEADVLVTAAYGYRFVAGVERGNIAGMQFHPEKSHKYGMRLLEAFARS